MGSRVMHLIIANRIAEQCSITDKISFLLGGVAPDAVSPKEASHFFAGYHDDYSRRIDYHQFIDKYSSRKHSDFILGYYTHLIADDIWLKGFYLPWLKNRLEKDKKVAERYHADFRLLNGKLLEYYNYKSDFRSIFPEKIEIEEVEEVKEDDILKFLPHLFQDMAYEQSSLDKILRVFTLEQILGYIETSVEQGTIRIKNLR